MVRIFSDWPTDLKGSDSDSDIIFGYMDILFWISHTDSDTRRVLSIDIGYPDYE